MFRDEIHIKILNNYEKVTDWIDQKRKGLPVPVYASFDIRESNYKAAVIDANIFPGGFNNICQMDKDHADEILLEYFNLNYSAKLNKIALLTEEHTGNKFYWDNVKTLEDLFQRAGFQVKVAVAKADFEATSIEAASGQTVQVGRADRKGDHVEIDGFVPDIIISNNDFSKPYTDWIAGLQTPVNPPYELGWHRRKKSRYFEHYNLIASEFAELIGVDPWTLQVETSIQSDMDLSSPEGRAGVAEKISEMLINTKKRFQEQNIDEKPFLMLKNNSGTYGMAVVKIESAEQMEKFNNRSRTKMKASKGGLRVQEAILQEGIPTIVRSGDSTAEPTIYMIGSELAGGFLRTHSSKGPEDNLNSPGAVFQRLCVSDLKVDVSGSPLENVYGWLARLGLLAVSKEMSEIKV